MQVQVQKSLYIWSIINSSQVVNHSSSFPSMQMPRAAHMLRLAGLLAIAILLSRSEAQASISCPTVIEELAPCASFLRQNSSNQPAQACCNGVKNLSGQAGSQKDRTAICQCLKQGLAKIGNYDPKRVSLLPKACGLSLTLPPIDQNTDCSNIIFTK